MGWFFVYFIYLYARLATVIWGHKLMSKRQFLSADAIVRWRCRPFGASGERSSMFYDRLRLLDVVRTAGWRLSLVQLPAGRLGRRHHRIADHHRRAARTTAQDVVPAQSAAKAARAVSHAGQYKRWAHFVTAGAPATCFRIGTLFGFHPFACRFNFDYTLTCMNHEGDGIGAGCLKIFRMVNRSAFSFWTLNYVGNFREKIWIVSP